MKAEKLLHCHSRGITFVELMLVLVIIATLITVSYPSLKGVHEHNKLKSAARELGSLMRYARAKAIFSGERVALFFDKEKQNYYVVMEEKEEDSDNHERESYIDRMHSLPDKVWFGKIEAGSIEEKSSTVSYILFFPNSTATEATIILENKKGNKMSLQVSQATALVKAAPGEIKKEEEQETEEVEEFYKWQY